MNASDAAKGQGKREADVMDERKKKRPSMDRPRIELSIRIEELRRDKAKWEMNMDDVKGAMKTAETIWEQAEKDFEEKKPDVTDKYVVTQRYKNYEDAKAEYKENNAIYNAKDAALNESLKKQEQTSETQNTGKNPTLVYDTSIL